MADLKTATMINSRCATPLMVLLLVIVAFARLCDAIHFTNPNWDVRAGETFRLTWVDQVRLGTIMLLYGRPENSDNRRSEMIVYEISDLQYDWPVPDDQPEGDYFFWIKDVSDSFSFSAVFNIKAAANLTTAFSMSIGPPTTTSSLPSSTGTSIPADSTPSSNPGLSTGAQASIGIGVAIIVILMVGGVGYFFYNRGKAVGTKGAQIRDDDFQNDVQYYKETKSTSIFEMDANPEPMELGVREHCTVEMPALVQVLELESPRFGVNAKSYGGSISPASPRVEVDKIGSGKRDLESQYKG